MPQLKFALKVFVVNGLVLLAGLVVIEFVFGGWFNEGRLNLLNLLRNCTLKFDVAHLYDDPNPTIRYTRDEYGLRGDFGTPDHIDMLTIGGSTTDQRYIRDGETWQDVLQRRCRQAGVNLEVANAGVDGQSTYGHIKDFEWWFPNIPGLRPSYVLFYVGLNDFYKEAGDSFDALAIDDNSIRTQVKTKSILYHAARTARGAYQAMVVKKIGHRSVDFNTVDYTDRPLQTDYSFMDERLAAYASRLRALADMTEGLGARPVFVSQPSRRYRVTATRAEGDAIVDSYDGHEFNGVDYYFMMRRLDSVTGRVAREKNGIFVDLAAHTGWEDSDFYDYEHMTPQGAKKVGDLLYESLKGVVTIPAKHAAVE